MRAATEPCRLPCNVNKRQLNLVTFCDVWSVVKIPLFFTHAVYFYGFCEGKTTAAVEEHRRRFPNPRIPDRLFFAKFSTHCVGALYIPRSCLNPNTNVDEDENILQFVDLNPTNNPQRISLRLGVLHTTAQRTLCEHGLYPFHVQYMQHLLPEDAAIWLELCERLNANRPLPRLVLFVNEATFTRDGINNTRTARWWSEENPHVLHKKFSTSLLPQSTVRYHR